MKPKMIKKEVGEYGWELYPNQFNPFEGIAKVSEYDKFTNDFELGRDEILTIAERWKENWRTHPVISKRKKASGLESFLIYELGYGGMVVSISENSIVTRTNCMSDVDYTYFYSPISQVMEDFVTIAHMWTKIIQKETDDSTWDIIKPLNGNPLMIKLASGLLIGKDRLKRIYMAALGVDWDFLNREDISVKDITSVWELKEAGATREEIEYLLT